ncbi:hypothetical protein LXA43DRAFT_893471, partial [Ganoderma leucocontextum]
SSTRNTRIERMWLEVGIQFAIRWRAFFTRLERCHGLDPEKPGHLWLLHALFLAEINVECSTFQHDWNRHSISGAGKGRTPLDMRFLSHLEHGYLPSDDLNDVHPDLLSRYYGTEGPEQRRRSDQTGAGHYDVDSDAGSDHTDSEETETSVDPELEEHIEADQEHHVRHPPIPVPDSRCPFESPEILQVFWECVREVQWQDIIPEHYGLREEEWENREYGDEETVSFGRRGRKVDVPLPFSIWYPRAARWAQGLEAMTELVMMQGGEI